jgi:hypothetical protein
MEFVRISVDVPKAVHQSMREIAVANDTKVKHMVEKMLVDKFDRAKKNAKS